jgi:hypothetical protein
MRGLQIFPQELGENRCANWEEHDDDDDNQIPSKGDNLASNFVWSADSSKIVFAVTQLRGGVSLILVKMPEDNKGPDRDEDHMKDRDRKDLPRTFVYKFVGTEDVCAGDANCDSSNVRSVAWNGDSVNVALVQANPTGPAIVKNLTIPLSKFVPLAK